MEYCHNNIFTLEKSVENQSLDGGGSGRSSSWSGEEEQGGVHTYLHHNSFPSVYLQSRAEQSRRSSGRCSWFSSASCSTEPSAAGTSTTSRDPTEQNPSCRFQGERLGRNIYAVYDLSKRADKNTPTANTPRGSDLMMSLCPFLAARCSGVVDGESRLS